MSEEKQQQQMPDFNSMSIEEKLNYLHALVLNTNNVMVSFIKYLKHDDKFKRHYEKEQKALRAEYEEGVKKKAKIKKIDK